MLIVLVCIHSKLKTQWDDKIQVITTLEESMSRLQQTFADKERKLVHERDLALEASRYIRFYQLQNPCHYVW